MGRWSRPLADRFVRWLAAPPGLAWLDVGCGTGALASAIMAHADPSAIVACDPSDAFVEHARATIRNRAFVVVRGDSDDLPERPGGFDRVVSALVLNFAPDPRRALESMRTRTRRGGEVAATVWDYAGRMEFLRFFWDEAIALDPAAAALDEGARFPIGRKEVLVATFRDAGLRDVASDAIEIPTRFESFEDYWEPFLGATGPAPAHVASLSETKRNELRDRLERRLSPGAGGAIDLTARAWAIRGTVP